MTAIITTDVSNNELEKENDLFKKVSGSKINMEKNSKLKCGLFEAIPKQYCKATIKVLGCFFGSNEFQNFQKAIVKIENIVKQ